MALFDRLKEKLEELDRELKQQAAAATQADETDGRGRAPLTFYQGRLNALTPVSEPAYSAASS